ncbi:MAG: hypothetical protein HZA64_07710 [Rhodocyclales bacterium]|nr:hypothetical protein [Rhodocyclales bacterium]
MRHLEPEPQQDASITRPKLAARKSTSAWKAILFGAALVVGAGYGLTAWLDPLPVDHVTEKQKSELLTEFTKLKGISIAQVAGGDMERAMDSMRLDPAARQALTRRLEVTKPSPPDQPEVRETILAELTLWDFAAQDGDIVRVSSAGYEIEVSLLSQPTTVPIPVDGSRVIKIQGARDGGGGITLGIQNGTQPISLPVLKPGQVLNLPVY